MMDRYDAEGIDDDEAVECPECDGTGASDEPETSPDPAHNHRGKPDVQDCPICCGFGRLDW